MKNKSILIKPVGILFTLLLAIQQVNAGENSYPITVNSENTGVKFSKLSVNSHDHQKTLSGKIKHRLPYNNTLFGHIEVHFKNENNQILQTKVVKYLPGRISKRSRSGRNFSVILPTNLPKNSRIEVLWHKIDNHEKS